MSETKSKSILVIGGGGREHAIVRKLRQSPGAGRIYCAPGNAGIAEIAECLPIKAMEIDAAIDFAKREKIDFVVVAPDDPLAAGMVDKLEAAGIKAFGPCAAAARLESSKAFSKDFMRRNGIPTAAFQTFTDYEEALAYLRAGTFPAVIKADGLALGKGVIIAADFEEGRKALDSMMKGKIFGESGSRVVIEEYLTGPEVTVLAFTDGVTISPMVSSQDHKRAFDGDKGPNTGGMGAFAPSRHYDTATAEACMRTIFRPTVDGLMREGVRFKGVIYFGLMLTPAGPKVIEYNARFGDPETQAVLSLLESDLLEIFEAVSEGRLADIGPIRWSTDAAACVVIASGGYPGKYDTGFEITGLKAAEDAGAVVYHAGTRADADGTVRTAGGRVLGVTCTAADLETALKSAYKAVKFINFEKAHYRTDIGVK